MKSLKNNSCSNINLNSNQQKLQHHQNNDTTTTDNNKSNSIKEKQENNNKNTESIVLAGQCSNLVVEKNNVKIELNSKSPREGGTPGDADVEVIDCGDDDDDDDNDGKEDVFKVVERHVDDKRDVEGYDDDEDIIEDDDELIDGQHIDDDEEEDEEDVDTIIMEDSSKKVDKNGDIIKVSVDWFSFCCSGKCF